MPFNVQHDGVLILVETCLTLLGMFMHYFCGCGVLHNFKNGKVYPPGRCYKNNACPYYIWVGFLPSNYNKNNTWYHTLWDT